MEVMKKEEALLEELARLNEEKMKKDEENEKLRQQLTAMKVKMEEVINCLLVLRGVPCRSGAGSYFRPWATLGFYLCLAGQIQVKYTFSKLQMEPPRAGCCPLLL